MINNVMSDVHIDNNKMLPSKYHTIVGHVVGFSQKKKIGRDDGHVVGNMIGKQVGHVVVLGF